MWGVWGHDQVCIPARWEALAPTPWLVWPWTHRRKLPGLQEEKWGVRLEQLWQLLPEASPGLAWPGLWKGLGKQAACGNAAQAICPKTGSGDVGLSQWLLMAGAVWPIYIIPVHLCTHNL